MQETISLPSIFAGFDLSPGEQKRYRDLRETLRPFIGLFKGKRVLDFGASYGLSAAVLVEHGAANVWGVEPEEWRVEKGTEFMSKLGIADRVHLSHVRNTKKLDAEDSAFSFILVNAVFEHIPQPRDDYVRELWRVLAPGGSILIRETPNKYLPVDFHTLHLPLTNWLPSSLAHRIGKFFGRFDPLRTDWAFSGWRGMGYYELTKAIPGPYLMEHEVTRARHRLLRSIGLPSGLLDPYPIYVLRKPS
jgi:ubiquinone/menaquinone biosynthesis C-methylase UbiE